MSRIYAPNLLTDATLGNSIRRLCNAEYSSGFIQQHLGWEGAFHQSLTTWCCFHLGSSLNSAVLKISKSSIFQAWLTFPQDWSPSPTLGNGLTRKDGHFWQKCLFLSLKNGTWGSKLLRPLLEAQQSPKVMELPFVLSVFQFWVDFQPILKFGICFAIF